MRSEVAKEGKGRSAKVAMENSNVKTKAASNNKDRHHVKGVQGSSVDGEDLLVYSNLWIP